MEKVKAAVFAHLDAVEETANSQTLTCQFVKLSWVIHTMLMSVH